MRAEASGRSRLVRSRSREGIEEGGGIRRHQHSAPDTRNTVSKP